MISCIRDIYVLLSVATSWRRKKNEYKTIIKSEQQGNEKYFHWWRDFSNARRFQCRELWREAMRCRHVGTSPRDLDSPCERPFSWKICNSNTTILKPVPRIVELHCKNNRKYTYKWKMFFSGKDGNDQS